jgi:hypothetical protein
LPLTALEQLDDSSQYPGLRRNLASCLEPLRAALNQQGMPKYTARGVHEECLRDRGDSWAALAKALAADPDATPADNV